MDFFGRFTVADVASIWLVFHDLDIIRENDGKIMDAAVPC